MIRISDNIIDSIRVIHQMWTVSPRRHFLKPLPRIPNDMSLDDLRGFLNTHLFESGMLNSQVFRASYRIYNRNERVNKEKADGVKRMLDEMFCGPEWHIPLIGGN